LQAPAEVSANTDFSVKFTGPNTKRSYIAIVKVGAPESDYGSSYTYVEEASGSVTLHAPDTGTYELRYISPDNKALYSIPITVK
jgi:Ca-activated chloride channel family protein